MCTLECIHFSPWNLIGRQGLCMQLGDPERKVASNASYLLSSLLTVHPNMKVQFTRGLVLQWTREMRLTSLIC